MNTVSTTKCVELKNRKTGETQKLNVRLTKIPKGIEVRSESTQSPFEEYYTDALRFQDDDGGIFEASMLALHPNEDRPFELEVKGQSISVHVTYQWIIDHLIRK